ncbi:hypothetical protein PV08_00666 [Exophiala spinifera]|uniref:Uncharacterized protein n=1 Tax=Exophiala spinifera TaxID=91928 RepID=A0A0D1YXU2_9EURO|nr:uncharacterized protein PV08_00666 [Exophiala spinifera]KIW20091.1 hypothetical protein PV08_00666 [Exophiala spinifera]
MPMALKLFPSMELSACIRIVKEGIAPLIHEVLAKQELAVETCVRIIDKLNLLWSDMDRIEALNETLQPYSLRELADLYLLFHYGPEVGDTVMLRTAILRNAGLELDPARDKDSALAAIHELASIYAE